jgi:molybdopterin-guanine dinucleotide biosynthesis protein A
VLACDLPRVPVELLAELASSVCDWAVPRWERGLEPLCAFYGPVALAVLAEKGLRAPHRLAKEDLAIRYLEGDDLAWFGPPEEVFLNLNTPEDLERYNSKASGTSP